MTRRLAGADLYSHRIRRCRHDIQQIPSHPLRGPKPQRTTQGWNTAPRRRVGNRPILIKDALNGTTSTSYDLLDNPVTRIDAEGRKYAWAYDGLGRLINETDVAGQTTSYARDQAGNPYQTTNRLAEITRISYDALNRPTDLNYLKDGTAEALAYDPAGNTNQMQSVYAK